MADLDFRNILDLIFMLESSAGTDPGRLRPNEYGALGSYQLRPGAFQDIQRFPKWKNHGFEEVALDDQLAREAANDYLKVIKGYYSQQNLAPTRDALLAGYHAGMGNVVRNTTGPMTGAYLKKAESLRKAQFSDLVKGK